MNRDLIRLVISQAMLNSSMVLLVSVTALASKPIAPSEAYITVPVTLQFLGLLLATTPASLLMARVGRRNGFLLGNLLGVAAGVLGAIALMTASFGLLCLTSLIAGASNAFGQYYRFAAQEAVPPGLQARALGWVMFGGVIAAALGPQAAIYGQNLLTTAFAGAYLLTSAMFLIALVALWNLNLGRTEAPPRGGRALPQLIKDPALIVAIVAGITSYSIMSLLMNATTLAMDRYGFEFKHVGWVIQWHVLMMFAPSFFTGALMTRWGTRAVMVAGALLYVAAALLVQLGLEFAHFLAALLCLGLGWNFLFLGATRAVGEALAPAERPRGQALNETLVFGSAALATLFVAPLEAWLGWQMLNLWVLAPMAVVIALLVSVRPRVEAHP